MLRYEASKRPKLQYDPSPVQSSQIVIVLIAVLCQCNLGHQLLVKGRHAIALLFSRFSFCVAYISGLFYGKDKKTTIALINYICCTPLALKQKADVFRKDNAFALKRFIVFTFLYHSASGEQLNPIGEHETLSVDSQTIGTT